MDLNNFVAVSKLSRSEIISKINSGVIQGVSRIFHREDMDRWESEIRQVISGSDYSKQVEAYIDSLTRTDLVARKGGTKK